MSAVLSGKNIIQAKSAWKSAHHFVKKTLIIVLHADTHTYTGTETQRANTHTHTRYIQCFKGTLMQF